MSNTDKKNKPTIGSGGWEMEFDKKFTFYGPIPCAFTANELLKKPERFVRQDETSAIKAFITDLLTRQAEATEKKVRAEMEKSLIENVEHLGRDTEDENDLIMVIKEAFIAHKSGNEEMAQSKGRTAYE